MAVCCKRLVLGAALVALGGANAHAADEVEVLHWWTSGGEAAALNVLKEDLQSKEVGWAGRICRSLAAAVSRQ